MADRELEERIQSRLGSIVRGKYTLDSVLGIGGMAAVYAATHRNGKRFAIKMLHAELAAREDIRRRFVREGYVANAVDHPGAVSVLDDDVGEDGAAFLVMELLAGASLDELWKRNNRRMPVAVTLEVVTQLLDVLAAAHARSIVHRDIKPANVFVLYDGTVKVLDFGIARVRDTTASDSHATGTGAVLGTPAYMAPEQALGDVDRIDARTDVWAIGATAFALLAGRVVHDATNPAHVMVKAATDRAPPIASLVADLAPDVAAIIDRALAVEPGDRWQDAAAMAAAIRALAPSAKPALAALVAPRVRRPSLSEEAFDATRAPSQAPARAKTPTATTLASSVGVATSATAEPRPRRWIPYAIAGAVALAGGGWWALQREPAHGVQPAPRAVEANGLTDIVIVIANETPEPIFDGTLDSLFRSALYRSPHALPYGGVTLRELATELGGDLDPAAIAKRLFARDGRRAIAVQGKVTARGKGYAISITAADAPTGARVFERTAEVATINEVNAATGTLATDLLHELGYPPPTGAATSTGMSDNLDADHEELVSRASVSSGKYADAIAHAERAVAIDPQFSLAHSQLGIAYYNAGRRADADRELKLALRTIDRMSDHDRLQFLGAYYSILGEYDRSIDALKELVEKWPTDPVTANNLALSYAKKRDLTHALEVGTPLAHEHPRSIHARSNLAVYDSLAGKFADAVREAKSVIADFPRPAGWTYLYLAIAEHALHDEAAALDAAQTLAKTDASLAATVRADLLLATGKTSEAIQILEAALPADEDNHDAAQRKQALLAEAYLRHGDRTRARAAADAAAASSVASTRFMAARAYVAAGDPAKALAIADKLDAELAPDARLYGALVRGEGLLARGNAREAVAAFEKALPIADSWLAHEALARAYIELGAFAEAHNELATCTARAGEGSSAFMDDLSTPTMRYAFYSRYYLARAQEGMGSPDARDSYEAFVAGLAPDDRDPRVVDARKRLAAH